MKALWPWRSARPRSPSPAQVIDDATLRREPPIANPVFAILTQIETTCLDVYEQSDLPTNPGQYARHGDGPWQFVGDGLSAEERWSLILHNPREAGWRFGSLEDLGATSTSPDVQVAATLLKTCRRLRGELAHDISATGAIEAAVRLGMDWQLFQTRRRHTQAGPLKLSAPSSRKRSVKR